MTIGAALYERLLLLKIKVLESVAELFYQEQIAMANKKLLKAISLLTVYIETIEEPELKQEILGELNKAVLAMESEDHTLLADVLQHEIVTRLKIVVGEE